MVATASPISILVLEPHSTISSRLRRFQSDLNVTVRESRRSESFREQLRAMSYPIAVFDLSIGREVVADIVGESARVHATAVVIGKIDAWLEAQQLRELGAICLLPELPNANQWRALLGQIIHDLRTKCAFVRS
jgi:hypothetical protein